VQEEEEEGGEEGEGEKGDKGADELDNSGSGTDSRRECEKNSKLRE
jgi:hypothetical protein